VPGLFYLVALNLIVAHRGHPFEALAQVLIYNVVWFVIPIAALAMCVVRPATARDGVEAIQAFAKRHARAIVLVVSFGVGAVLVVRGLLAI
jgi:sulfopyruvate decarboxylase TPP-binding subunit